MKPLRVLAATSLLVIASAPVCATGNFISGGQLHEYLAAYQRVQNGNPTGTDLTSAFEGMGYVLGVSDTLDDHVFCLPGATTKAQVVAIVEKYLNDHPERWQYTANSLIADALETDFPCTKEGAKQ
jgi:hypothetical protein